jgi:hypothetical protein
VSTDAGQTWQTVWSKAGNDGNSAVDPGFVDQSISLAGYAGEVLQVRFVYSYSGGYFFPGGFEVGLYLDNIGVSNSEEVTGATTNNVVSGTSFSFTPTVLTNYLLEVRPQIGTRTLAWGPAFPVNVSSAVPAPVIQLVQAPAVLSGQVQLDFIVTNYRSGMTFQLLKASTVEGPWSQDASATLQTLVANSKFRFSTSTGGAQQLFFRIKGG